MLRAVRSLALAFLLTTPAVAAPALWQVSDEDSSIWLFGSVHMLQPGTEWRSETLDKLLVKADRVYFETDISAEAQMRIAPLSFEVGFYRDGSLLSEHIEPELMDRLRAVAADYGIPVPSLLIMRPWMAATTLSVMVLAETGYDPLLGVETVLGNEVPKERTGYLETPEEQIGILAGGSPEEEIAMLEATLDGLDVMTAEIDGMVAAWLAGTPESLGELFMAQMGAFDETFVTRLIDERNANWANQIEQMLAANEAALLIVGAAHLIDEVSVVRMLEEKGFTSRRIQ